MVVVVVGVGVGGVVMVMKEGKVRGMEVRKKMMKGVGEGVG